MKLTVLGCWAPYPTPNQACSGYLLEHNDKRLLIDLGHGSFGKLQQVSDFSRLDAVFISHLHPDHCADLSCLRHAVLGEMRKGNQRPRLPVYMPSAPAANFDILANFEDAFEVHIVDTDSCLGLAIAGMECQVFKTAHPIPTFGLVAEGNKKFVYTSDTSWEDKLVDLCRHAGILLCEASLAEADAHLATKGHLTAAQAGLLAARSEVSQLVITHFWPGYVPEDLGKEVSNVWKGKCALAREFGEYTC